MHTQTSLPNVVSRADALVGFLMAKGVGTRQPSKRRAALPVFGFLIALLLNAGPANATLWSAGDLTTYSQGNWGGDPLFPDAGALLLVNHFDTVYAPTSGAIVGSLPGYTMVFTDAASVLAYMPSIGPFGPLTGS